MWSDESMNKLIGHIYDSAMDPSVLQQVVADLTTRLGMTRSVYWTPYELHGERACWIGHGCDPTDVREYQEYYYQQDIWTRKIENLRLNFEGSVVDTDDVVALTELKRSEFYNDSLRHTGIERALSVGIGQSALSDVMHVLTLQADSVHGEFRPEEIELLKQLRPHFARANKLRHALQQSQAQQASISDTLDQLDTLVIVCDADARIDLMNRSAELWLGNKRWACVSMGRLSLHDSQAQAQLEHFLKQPLQTWGEAGLIPVGRDEHGQPRYLLRILPLPEAANTLLQTRAQPRFALTINLDQAPQSLLQLLQTVFRLTPAEARIARDIVQGLSVSEVAEAQQLSIHTVRSALKIIFSKTGCRRQADLVGIVGRLA